MAYKYDPIAGKVVMQPDGVAEKKILDAGVIAEITSGANWDVGGNYTGSLDGLVNGNVHHDDNNNLKYCFDGTTLRRFLYNEAV